MSTAVPFVGRQGEQDIIRGFLESEDGLAMMVVGPQGFGKSSLLESVHGLSSAVPGVTCCAAYYDVKPYDPPENTFELILYDIFAVAGVHEGPLSGTSKRRKQIEAILNLPTASLTIGPPGAQVSIGVQNLGSLLSAFRNNRPTPARERLVEVLATIGENIDPRCRVCLIIDPDPEVSPDSDAGWAHVIRNLPKRVKLVFAQRPGGVLITGERFAACPNVVMVPIGELGRGAVEELVQHSGVPAHLQVPLQTALEKYNGHPYAVSGAVRLGACLASLEI